MRGYTTRVYEWVYEYAAMLSFIYKAIIRTSIAAPIYNAIIRTRTMRKDPLPAEEGLVEGRAIRETMPSLHLSDFYQWCIARLK